MKSLSLLFLAISVLSSLLQAGPLQDDFSNPELPERQALRGQWTFEYNEAHCQADPELYEKFSNHGPILRWAAGFQDGTVELEFRPEGCEQVVINLNDDIGHVFKVSLGRPNRSGLYAWTERSKGNPADALMKDGVPTIDSVDGAWVKLKLVIEGTRCTATVGEFQTVVEHAGLARPRNELTIGFSSGKCSVRQVKVEPS